MAFSSQQADLERLEKQRVVPLSERPRTRRLMMIDDDLDVCALYRAELIKAGFEAVLIHSYKDLNNYWNVSSDPYDAFLLDLQLGDADGLDILPVLLTRFPQSKIWVLSATDSIERAVTAMKRGASGFFSKNRNPEEVAKELKASFESQWEIFSNNPQKPAVNCGLIGSSPSTRFVVHCIQQMKDVDSTILICGESGTGKEVIARALHQLSSRAGEHFAAINCAAIPENLLESELFGHRRGAFTDARVDRKGLFELCSQGTLLLDEVGDMPLPLQAKLLRVLQEKELRPLGSSETIKVNTRVVASTNRNLEKEVKAGRFREDLYYRLSVLRIESRPLREHKEDIPVLLNHFVQRFNEKFKKHCRVSQEIIARSLSYDWPGNVRELQNACERAVVLSQSETIRWEDLFFLSVANQAPGEEPTAPSSQWPPLPLDEVRRQCEIRYLTQLLKATRGNVSEVARLSKEHRPRLYRLLKGYRLNPLDFRNG